MKTGNGLCRFLCIILAGLLMLPASVSAESSVPLIRLGTDSMIPGNTVWFGSEYSNYLGEYLPSEVNWRVLQNEDGKALLIMDTLIKLTPFSENTDRGNSWQGSDAQQWCEKFYDSYVDTAIYAEQEAILATTITETENYYGESGTGGPASLNNEHFFFLSVKEAESLFSDDDDRIAFYVVDDSKKIEMRWWLRTPNVYSAEQVFSVGESGHIDVEKVNGLFFARPAFNLDLSAVLFSSAAVGGKASAAEGGGLYRIEKSDTTDWKLTILDRGRIFAAQPDSDAVLEKDAGYAEWSIPFSYTGAETGKDEMISALLCKDGEAVYYGKVLSPDSAGGTAAVSVPAGLTEGDYTLYLFNEQLHGDKVSDISSKFSAVSLKVTGANPPGTASSPAKIPATGDSASPALWIGLVVLGLLGVAMVDAVKRRRL